MQVLLIKFPDDSWCLVAFGVRIRHVPRRHQVWKCVGIPQEITCCRAFWRIFKSYKATSPCIIPLGRQLHSSVFFEIGLHQQTTLQDNGNLSNNFSSNEYRSMRVISHTVRAWPLFVRCAF